MKNKKETMSLVCESNIEEKTKEFMPASAKIPQDFILPKITSNGYEIYYNEKTGEAEGIVFMGRVICKKTSSEKMNWYEAVDYCKTVIVNGIQSELCPMDRVWRNMFRAVYEDLRQALQEIGAEHLDCCTWCVDHSNCYAWCLRITDGVSYNYCGKAAGFYIRPILVLKK